MRTTKAIAFFDFDDTLARGDSILPYLLYCIRRGYAPVQQVFKAASGFIGWKLRPSTGRAAKEKTLSYITGRSVEEMDKLARDFFREEQSKRFFREGAAELQRLRDAGVMTVIVSASSDVYMRVLPEFLPVDAVISTTCEVKQGRYTGKVGKNCKGEEKVRRINLWLETQRAAIDRDASSGYGDSPSDQYMMKLTGRPVLVNPKKKLVRALPDAQIVRWQ